MSSDQPGPYAQQQSRSPGPDARREEPGPQPYPQAGAPAAPGEGGGGGSWRRGRGRTVGVIAGVLVLVAACVGGYFLLRPADPPSYRLTTPRTVAGDYTRDGKAVKGDGSAFGGKKVPGMTSEANVNAKYKSGMLKQLQLGGAYGSVRKPAKAVDWVLARTRDSLKQNTGATAKNGPRAFHPAGFKGKVLECQEYKISTMGLSLCVWGDSSTVGTVTSFELSGGESTRPVDLKRTAELTAKVRADALRRVKH